MLLPQIGDLLAEKYRIDSVLGEGGFGMVYRATTLSTGRVAAIKVLKPVDGDVVAPRRAERFMRELRAIAQLQSPNTVSLYDYGRTDNGLLYMVCEYIEGEDLVDLLARRGTLSERETVHVLEQALRSLAEAHQAGILHRDLKPGNIRIHEYLGDPLRVKLLDFGLAKSLGSDEAALTGTGKVVGTLRFMSPEQMLGFELTPASDIYSLALVGYDMLMGAHVRKAGQRAELTGNAASKELAAVMNQMLAWDVEARIKTAPEALVALAAIRGQAHDTVRPHLAPVQSPPADDQTTTVHAADALGESANDQAKIEFRQRVALAATACVISAIWLAVSLLSPSREELAPAPPPKHRAENPLRTVGTTEPEHASLETEDTGPQVPGSGCGRPAPFAGAGTFQEIDGLTSKAVLGYVPKNYDPNVGHALILLLHESGETPRESMDRTHFAEIAEREGFVMVAPFDRLTPRAAWQQASDVAIAREALRMARENLCLDDARVYAVSHGSGGHLVERAPCELPQIRAIATSAHRGSPDLADGLCRPEHPIPYLHLAALHDGYNPVAGGPACTGRMKVPLAMKEQQWRERNRCEPKQRPWFDRGRHECVQWDCEAVFALCRIDGGRGWDRTPQRAWDMIPNCDGEPADFPYAETIWRFLETSAADPSARLSSPARE